MSPRSQAAALSLDPVHSVPYDEPGRTLARARCGLTVNRRAQRGAITCAECLEAIAHFESLDFGKTEEEFAVTHPLFTALPDGEPESDEPSAVADAPVVFEAYDEVPQALAPVLVFKYPEASSPAAEPADPVEFPDTLIAFPVLMDGETRLAFDKLADPARLVAELVERLEPVLAPPPVVANLELLVLQANAVQVVDAASYQRAVALYEELAANEKGIEESIGPVVAFFHRPWKALTSFRARFAKPVADAKKRLSDTAGAWKLADDQRVAREQREAEELLQQQERERLQALAKEAAKQQKPELAALATAAAETVARPTLPVAAFTPTVAQTGTGNRKKAEALVTDEDAFYRGLADGTISRNAAPVDQGWLNRQANDYPKDEFEKRFPGVTWQQKGGLTARGNR